MGKVSEWGPVGIIFQDISTCESAGRPGFMLLKRQNSSQYLALHSVSGTQGRLHSVLLDSLGQVIFNAAFERYYVRLIASLGLTEPSK